MMMMMMMMLMQINTLLAIFRNPAVIVLWKVEPTTAADEKRWMLDIKITENGN